MRVRTSQQLVARRRRTVAADAAIALPRRDIRRVPLPRKTRSRRFVHVLRARTEYAFFFFYCRRYGRLFLRRYFSGKR